MVSTNAKERTLNQFTALFDASGWKIEKVYQPAYYAVGHTQIVLAPA